MARPPLNPAEQDALHELVAAVRCEVEGQDVSFTASDYEIARVIEAVRPLVVSAALKETADAWQDLSRDRVHVTADAFLRGIAAWYDMGCPKAVQR